MQDSVDRARRERQIAGLVRDAGMLSTDAMITVEVAEHALMEACDSMKRVVNNMRPDLIPFAHMLALQMLEANAKAAIMLNIAAAVGDDRTLAALRERLQL